MDIRRPYPVEENYEFDDDSYTALGAAGVAWQDAVFVLVESRPVVRRHIGAVLNVAGRDRQGRWLARTTANADIKIMSNSDTIGFQHGLRIGERLARAQPPRSRRRFHR
ncbi:MAG TPA: hypothetical protein VN408_31555 [Actinoplanes sp.]|nr:hypothetical protein [Actinoplanes sp.]